MTLAVIDEGSRLQIRVTYEDGLTGPVTPATAKYRVDCATTGTVIQDWLAYTPAGISDVLIITPDQNAIINSRNPEEQKTLTVIANPNTPAQFVKSFDWLVINLQGIS